MVSLLNQVTELERLGKIDAAFQECLRLAETGLYEAQTNLAWKYQHGEGTHIDIQAAEEWYTKASDTELLIDKLSAQFYLACLFVKTKRETEACDLMEIVANQGYLPAAFRLGEMLTNGVGCTRDEELGKYYREYAAKHGNVWAQRYVAVSMIRGDYGWTNIPHGLLRYILALVSFIRAYAADPNSQKALG